MKPLYTNFYTITDLQQKIMRFIHERAHKEKTPISKQQVLDEMEKQDENRKGVSRALEGLIKQGYIRKAITSGGEGHSTVKYVQLRSL